jgi:hypothetical protein
LKLKREAAFGMGVGGAVVVVSPGLAQNKKGSRGCLF